MIPTLGVSVKGTVAEPGETLIGGRYRLESELGKGGMGAVYGVVDLTNGQPLALKRLLHGAGGHQGHLFEREYRTLAGLRHPRIVEVYEYGVDDQGVFYTMERLEGRDLSRAAPMPWRDVCACLRDAASILGVLHARRLVHRDLSPRNLWRTPDGRIKLLDFGALAPFGEATEVVGTPPFVPPEALAGDTIDGRTDLYALGALGYWLLTGTHAFRATGLGELPRLWQREPALPSSLAGLLGGEVPDVPADLDRLVLELLRREPDERPASTVEVIDHLNAIADLPPETQSVVVQGYLDSKAFVGRLQERERFGALLMRSKNAQARAVFVAGSEGVGRTRLLEELATSARVAGALTVSVDASGGTRAYAAACSLVEALLGAAPGQAHQAAEPYAPVLGYLSPSVHERLGAKALDASLEGARDERARKQAALTQWIVDLSHERFITLLVDDLHALDEESQALIASLAHAPAGSRLLVVATGRSEETARGSAAVRSFLQVASRWDVPALSSDDALELLRSLFGEVPYLERLATRLHARSDGNPRYLLLLAQHLVQTGEVYYADGTWALPTEIAEETLPASLHAGLLARLDGLDTSAREAARRISVPDRGAFTREMFCAVSGMPEVAALQALSDLVSLDVVRATGHGYGFVYPALREALYAELSANERTRAHAVLGEIIEARSRLAPPAMLRVSLHYLRAGQFDRAAPLVNAAGQHYSRFADDELREASRMLAEAVELFRQAGRTGPFLLQPLAALSVVGYLIDRQYATRYGEDALQLGGQVLRLSLARRLGAILGAKPGLLIAFLVAAVALKFKRNAPSFTEAVHCLLATASALSATAATCAQPKLVWGYAAVIEPLTALGPDHAATIVHRLCVVLAVSGEERPGEADLLFRSLLDRLASWAPPITGLTDEVRHHYLAGVIFSFGIRGAFKDDGRCLESAERLEAMGPLYQLNADHLRGMYYAFRGDFERASEYRRRVGVQAVQQGSAWRVETLGATALVPALWAQDAIGVKRAADVLSRVAVDIPSFGYHERSARAGYLVARGKFSEALQLLADSEEEPLFVLGWARTRSLVAAAYNGLGCHEEARRVCEETLAHLSPDDLEFVGLNLNLQVELAQAEAGLGAFAKSRQALERLIAQHASKEGPLLLAYLHRAAARAALLAGEFDECRGSLQEMGRWVRPLRIPSLSGEVEALRQQVQFAENPDSGAADGALQRDDVHLVTRVQMMLRSTATQRTDRGETALRVALDVSGADGGFFVLASQLRPVFAAARPQPSDAIIQWATEYLTSALEDDETAMLESDALDGEGTSEDPSLRVEGERRSCATPVWTMRGHEEYLVAVLVLEFEGREPERPGIDVLRVIAGHLGEIVSQAEAIAQSSSGDCGA